MVGEASDILQRREARQDKAGRNTGRTDGQAGWTRKETFKPDGGRTRQEEITGETDRHDSRRDRKEYRRNKRRGQAGNTGRNNSRTTCKAGRTIGGTAGRIISQCSVE